MNQDTDKKFVIVTIDVHCEWLSHSPEYRVFVNGEMFADRTFRWDKNTYLQEVMCLEASAGIYTVNVECLGKPVLNFSAKNLQIEKGKARKLSDTEFEVH